MARSLDLAKRFLAAEEGATMVEYGLMIALIAAVCITTVKGVGSGINAKFSSVSSAINGAAS